MYLGRRVLDLGCGCGVRGIMAGLCGAKEVIATDICEVACRNTLLNIQRHRTFRVKVVCTDMFSGLRGSFDTIVAYLPSRDAAVSKPWERAIYDPGLRLNRQLFDEAWQYLVPGGTLHASLLDQGAIPEFLDQIASRGYELTSHKVCPHETGDWHPLSLRWPVVVTPKEGNHG